MQECELQVFFKDGLERGTICEISIQVEGLGKDLRVCRGRGIG